MYLYTKIDIWSKDKLIKKNSPMSECYSFISYLWRDSGNLYLYVPFITKQKAIEIGIV